MHVFSILGGIADLFFDYLGLLEQQVMVDIDIFSSQVESVPPEVIQLVHVDSVYLIAYQLKLPVPDPIFLTPYQGPHSLDFLLIGKMLLQPTFLDQVGEQHLTCDFMLPFRILLVPFFVFCGYFCDNVFVKSVAIGAMT